ncbi:MAG: hypothetical protein V4591_09295 [Bdellovibrionota bacterium]
MNLIFNEIIDNYKSLKFNIKDEYFNFFENWFRLHRELFIKMSEENYENFDEINKDFMNKRSRMASAFMQKMKLTPRYDE